MKKLAHIHQSSETHWVGNGFPVRSVFDYNGLGQELSPFLLLDYAEPYEFPPGEEKRGVGGHPHKGFETVTLVYQGELEHRDSSGGGGKIGPGDVQWMTAGKGIVHEEFHSAEFVRSGGFFQVAQLWVNLRAKDKNADSGYQTLLKADIPRVNLADGAGAVRVIAGHFGETQGPAKTHSAINLWEFEITAGKTVEIPFPEFHTSTFLVVTGSVLINAGRRANEGDLAIFERNGTGVTVLAEGDSKLLVMDGEPFNEPIVGQGPFVMNSRAEIEQAFDQYRMGEMGEIK